MADDALYQAARKGDLPETRVRRPIAVIAGRDVRRRACDYRPVVVSLANLPDQARRVSCLPEPRSESVVCRRSCKMAPTFPDASAFMTGRALPIFLVAPFIEQPLFTARLYCTVLGGTGGGRCDEYAWTVKKPVLVGHC